MRRVLAASRRCGAGNGRTGSGPTDRAAESPRRRAGHAPPQEAGRADRPRSGNLAGRPVHPHPRQDAARRRDPPCPLREASGAAPPGGNPPGTGRRQERHARPSRRSRSPALPGRAWAVRAPQRRGSVPAVRRSRPWRGVNLPAARRPPGTHPICSGRAARLDAPCIERVQPGKAAERRRPAPYRSAEWRPRCEGALHGAPIRTGVRPGSAKESSPSPTGPCRRPVALPASRRRHAPSRAAMPPAVP